jgi:hypothetical protein
VGQGSLRGAETLSIAGRAAESMYNFNKHTINGYDFNVLFNTPMVFPVAWDLGLGVDNLLHADKTKIRVRFTVVNLTNKEALYNFLSTFSGTHFVTPRAYAVQVGVTF